MFKPPDLLKNRNFILLLALVLGLLFGQGAQWTEKLVLPALAFVMMLSTTSITGSLFHSLHTWLAPLLSLSRALIGTLSCYLGAFIITPLILFTLLGSSFGFQVRLFITLVEPIIIPLILSRILLHTSVASRMATIKGTLTNWSFFPSHLYSSRVESRNIFQSTVDRYRLDEDPGASQKVVQRASVFRALTDEFVNYYAS